VSEKREISPVQSRSRQAAMNILLRSSIRVPAALLLLLLTPLTCLPVYRPACLPACLLATFSAGIC
jgi:hypothetical protein